MLDRRYRRSSAREEALERLHGLRRGSAAASKKRIPLLVRDMVYHSAIFQASSTLEEYLKQIFDYWVFEVRRKGLKGDSLPSRARFSYFGRELTAELHKYIVASDEKALALKLQSKTDIINFTIGHSTAPPGLDGGFAYKDKKYPSPKNIKSLYSRIGCDNIFDRLSREMKVDAELRLRGFNDIRTAIAHSNPPDLTLEDVNRNLDVISSIIKSLDKINHREFSRDFGGGVW